ncbi:MAG TPA: ERF family protein [Micromonosporaceae bacterium]
MSDKPTIVEALSAVMEDVQSVRKADRNTQQGYVFRGIDAVVNAVGPALRKHRVIALPYASTAQYRDVQTSTGKPSRECTVSVTYRFYGPAGDFLECTVPGESMDFGDKGAPKAMSVAYRIALLQALCIPTDDPEPDSMSYERAARPEWDPVEQDVLVTAWSAEITDAKTLDDLKDIGRKLLAAKRARELSPPSYDHLSRLGSKRKAEMDKAAEEASS